MNSCNNRSNDAICMSHVVHIFYTNRTMDGWLYGNMLRIVGLGLDMQCGVICSLYLPGGSVMIIWAVGENVSYCVVPLVVHTTCCSCSHKYCHVNQGDSISSTEWAIPKKCPNRLHCRIEDQHATSNIPVHGFTTVAAIQHQQQHILHEWELSANQRPCLFAFGEEGIKHSFGGANGLVQEMLMRTAKAKDASD